MILENFSPALHEDVDLETSDLYIGEAGELSELTANSLSEMHNLTVALARFEHKCLTENDQSLMEGAVSEYFKKAVATIKDWWDRFVAWLGSMWQKLKDAFVKRADWLSRNNVAIAAVGADKMGDAKVSIGANLFAHKFSGAAREAINAASALVAEAGKIEPEASKTFMEKVRAKLAGGAAAGPSVGKTIHDKMIGESKEVALTPGLVKQLLAVAHDTFTAVDQMKGAKTVAEAVLKAAEGLERVSDTERTAVNARITCLRNVGSAVQSTVAAYSSAISAANGQAMPILVRVASMGAKKEKEAAPAAKAAEAKNEGSSLLDAFM